MKIRCSMLIATMCLLLANPCVAAEEPSFVELRTERVVVFKDGYCLVIKKGRARTDERGEIHWDRVPDAAILGSFWGSSTDGNMRGMRAGWRESVEKESKIVDCETNLQILKANEGKRCRLFTTDGEEHEGTISKVLASRRDITSKALPPPPDLRGNFGHSFTSLSAPTAPTTWTEATTTSTAWHGSSFLLSSDTDDRLFAVADLKSLVIENMVTEIEQSSQVKKRYKQLSLLFEKPDVERDITLVYFRPGLRWIPTYRAELDPDPKVKKAKLTLQAEIINEVEDFDEVPIDIVVGVPNFRFKDSVSPLVMESTLRRTLQQAAPGLMGQMRNDFSNAKYVTRDANFRRQASGGSAVADGSKIDLPDELAATGARDLFIYHLPNQRLKRGDRIAVTISSATVPYRDVYTWDVKVSGNGLQKPAQSSSPLRVSLNQVWHQIELTNTTSIPWTTGAVMMMQGQQPISQELLTYTSPMDSVRVPLTVSVETRGSFHEAELNREPDALKWSGYRYMKIVNAVQLDLCNNKPIPVDVEISVDVGGKVEEVEEDGKVKLNTINRAIEHHSTVQWKRTLNAGETFTPQIIYHYFVRH